MSPQYGHVMLVNGYPVLTAANRPYCECPIKEMWICQGIPFLLLVSPTPPVQSIDKYVRSINHVTTKRKEVDLILSVWGSVRGSLAKKARQS